MPEIHHFVQEFVDDDKVVADAFFFQFLEVFGKDLDNLVEKQQELGGIAVALGQRQKVEVVVPDVEVLGVRISGWSCACVSARCDRRGSCHSYIYALVGEAWRYGGALFFGFGEENGELVHGGHRNVATVVASEEGLLA